MTIVSRTVATVAASAAILATANALTDLKSDWEAYTSPLVIPEVIDMTAGGHIDMQIGRGTHNWTEDGSISGDIYGYALMNSTATFPGPTIKVARGVPISVTWYNELSTPHLFAASVEPSIANIESHCYPYCGVPAVVHVHGLESPARYDGLPYMSIYQNQSQDAIYLNNQSASTKLYHDHANGLTRLNTWAGLMGAYIISDVETEAALNVDVETDIPLILNDRLINETGAIMYSDDNCNTAGTTVWVPESFGSTNVVNGVVMPYLEIPPAQVRFRLANTANARHYNLTVPFADKCKVIATDSGFVKTPTTLTSQLVMFPFERVEVICDFSDDADGTTYDLEDNQTADQPTPYDGRVMQFRINADLKTDTMTTKEVASTLNNYKSLKALYEAGGKERTVILGEMDDAQQCPEYGEIMYRSQQINMSTLASLHCTKGTVEKWNFQNPTDDPHPFHWHLVNAQCGETEETINTNELKDVVPIPNAGDRASTTITQVCYVACVPDEFLLANSTRSATDYGFDTTKPYVAHCHILEHEENAMMSWFYVMDKDDGYADDDGIATTGVITNLVIGTAMGMSVLGGIATTLSILVISVPRLHFLADPRSLSIAFALSAGVMVFIAFADLFTEALTYFRAAFTTGGTVDPEAYEHGGSSTSSGTCGNTCNGHAYLAAIASFFVGMAIILLVEYLVHEVLERKSRKKDANEQLIALASPVPVTDGDLDVEKALQIPSPMPGTPTSIAAAHAGNLVQQMHSPSPEGETLLMSEAELAKHKEEYHRAGMMTGIAIAIHNFPEGLALFVSSLQGLRTGIVLSIGIILHNLPEGVAVAAPVYYATGSKLEAFKWTAISGIAQPLGAAIGWLAVSGGMPYWLEAMLYGLVAGMLICITAKELLPGAYKFDPKGKLFVPSFFIGIAIIAFSLMALNYAGSS
jgi:FtsP/CotA-like multicopper oxidase with cupredoxin domain/zinc transporter ZupT